MENVGTGALESHFDPRTYVIQGTMSGFLVKGGIEYLPEDILHQHAVGICTSISLVQNRQKVHGRKFSADFQYLLQKKFFDGGWFEGSSIFNALRVGKNFGFLPLELWTHTTENDRYLPYEQYAAKLRAIPDEEINRLLKLCVDKIEGYGQVINEPQAIAKAINDSQGGTLCRYGCQSNWWTPSWSPKDINPLRYAPETSGHAIIMSMFDYSASLMQKLANTWGTLWCLQGCADINWSTYPPTEVWGILDHAPVIKHIVLKQGSKGKPVEELQKLLNIKVDGKFGPITLKAVKDFQSKNGLIVDGVVGKLTWEKLII